MKGWLVVNGFLKSNKFNELYCYFLKSAQQLNIDLQLVPSDALIGKPKNLPDFVLFWDKDVVLARRLEKLGVRLFNSASAVEICDSKTLTALQLDGVVSMPQTLFSPKTFVGTGYTNLNFVQTAADILGLPFVIKEEYGSFGEQVYLVHSVDEAADVAKKLAGTNFIMQKFIAESSGRDIRLNVVGGKVVNAILRTSKNGDFRSNITLGGTMQQHFPAPDEVRLAEQACKAIGLDFAGVDVLLSNNGPLLCEVNSNPHFKTTHVATGVDLSLHILQHIKNIFN